MDMKEKPVKLKATVMWCFHNKLNEMAEKYTIDLCNLTDNTVRELEHFGVNVMKRDDKPEKGFYITCKSTKPLEIFDASGKNLEDVAIGNGSTVTAVVSKYKWEFKNRSGWSPSLVKCVVDDLVAYESKSSEVSEETL